MSTRKHINPTLVSSSAILAMSMAVGMTAISWVSPAPAGAETRPVVQIAGPQRQTLHKTVEIDGVEVSYREAGPADAPTILLLHGFPTSSHMFRNLISALSDRYHLVAPDYPGFGNSAQPSFDDFEYSFDNLAVLMEAFVDRLGIEQYSLYLMDYGAPIGFRLAAKHPQRVQSLIVQNGNAYNLHSARERRSFRIFLTA